MLWDNVVGESQVRGFYPCTGSINQIAINGPYCDYCTVDIRMRDP